MRKLLMGAVGVLALAAGSEALQAAPVVNGPVMGAPTMSGPFKPPTVINVAKPDFVIAKLALTPIPNVLGPGQIGKITIDVADNCHRGIAFSPFVQATIYKAKGGQALQIVGNTTYIPGGGTGHFEVDIANLHLPMTSYIYAEVDPNNKIPEVVETNNYWSLNPGQGPFPQAQGYCNVTPPGGKL